MQQSGQPQVGDTLPAFAIEVTSVIAETLTELVGVGAGKDALRWIDEIVLGSADAFARRTSAYRRLRHKHGRSDSIAPDCRQNAEKRGAVAFRRIEVVAFALMPKDVCRIEPGFAHSLDGNGDAAIVLAHWCPLLNERIANRDRRENDGVVNAARNQPCR